MKIVISVACIIGGIGFLIWDIKQRRKQELNAFDKAMFARGLIGEVGLILIGILSLTE